MAVGVGQDTDDDEDGIRVVGDAIDEAIGPQGTSDPFGTALPQALEGGGVGRVGGGVDDKDGVRGSP